MSPETTSARLGEPSPRGGLWIGEGLVVEPAAAIGAWLEDCARREQQVTRLERAGGGWRLIGAGGEHLAEAEIVCLAAGLGARRLLADLPLEPVRGQASFMAAETRPTPAAWGGYVIPTRNGLLFGATHDRGQQDAEVRQQDHRRNLELLARARPRLAAGIDPEALEGRAGIRAATPDRLPLAGAWPDAGGLYLLAGLGGRGFTLAPLLAEHIAAKALGAPSPLPAPLARLVRPERFNAGRTPAINPRGPPSATP